MTEEPNVIPYPERTESPASDDPDSHAVTAAGQQPQTPLFPRNRDDEEALIIAAVREGDLSEFRILVDRYQQPVYNLMWRATGHTMTAEDLTQEAFTRAYAKLHTFKSSRRFFPWLYAIAVNLCRDHLRKKGRRTDVFDAEPEDGQWQDPNADDCAKKPDCVLEVKELSTAMEQLPMRYSEPMFLFYREGFSVKEIAAALKISVAAVKVRIFRGRNQLSALIGGGDETSA